MPLDRPLLSDLRARARADFNARLPGADSLLRQSNIGVTSDVIAGMLHLAYGRIEWVSQQVIPDTAEAQYLERWGDIFGVQRKAATKSAGNLLFTGIDGTAIPSGTIAQDGNQVGYQTTADAVIAGGQAIVPAEAVAAGLSGDAVAGVKLTQIAALPGIVAGVTLQSDFTGGTDDESDAELLGRLLFEIQRPPHGGNADDYVRWALEVPGVTRAWVVGSAGSVIVRFMMDDVHAADLGIPNSDDVQAVYDHIEPLRPVTAELFVEAPLPVPLDITIANLQVNTAAVQAAVIAELQDEFLRDAMPGGTIFLSWLWNAVSTASGERSHTIQAPNTDTTVTAGQIPVLGTVTFV